MASADERGSLWYRWDPHLHAPGTLLNDQFKGDWEAYLARIENSAPKIVALGVTDYFCIQTYRAVRAKKESGRLPSVQLLFPNVEMRIETKTASSHPINIHLLFSPVDPDHEAQIERILRHLEFEYDGTTYRCERSDLILLGKDRSLALDQLTARRPGGTRRNRPRARDGTIPIGRRVTFTSVPQAAAESTPRRTWIAEVLLLVHKERCVVRA